jgi:hypothetical protein
LVPWAQGGAEREIEMLPEEGKHVHEPPPEVLLRKGKHDTETPSIGEGERTEALQQGERMLEVPVREGGRKPESLQPDGERERDTTPQGCPNEGDRKPSWPSREQSLVAGSRPSTWEGQWREEVLGSWWENANGANLRVEKVC